VHWEPARIRGELAPQAARFAEPSARLEAVAARLHRDDDVRALVAALDGRTPFGELLARVRLPSTLAAAWIFEACGVLRFRDRPAPAAPAATDMVVPAIEIVVGGAAPEVSPRAHAPASRQPAPAARDAGEAERLRQEIVEARAALAQRDHYATLGVARDASAAALKRAYFQAAKRFHPDTLARMGLLELKDQARAVFAQIAKAHTVLSDPQRRKDYDSSLAAGGAEADGARLVQAETLYRKAQILLRAGNFTGALEFLRPAVELVSDDPAYRLALGWALYKGRPSDPEGARAELERATALAPSEALAHHRLGVVLRALGEENAAAKALARARQLDPSAGAG
jgi:tetratricopeptide (TPR) repeat protein